MIRRCGYGAMGNGVARCIRNRWRVIRSGGIGGRLKMDSRFRGNDGWMDSRFRGNDDVRPTLGLDVFRVPCEIPFIPVALITRPLNAVEFVGIDDQPRRNSETPQRFVHLLIPDHWNVGIFLSAEVQRWCLDAVRMQKGIR